MNLVSYSLGIYEPVKHDSVNPEHFSGWLTASILTCLVGVILTIRGVRRLTTENDGAFVWRAMSLQLAVFVGTVLLFRAFR